MENRLNGDLITQFKNYNFTITWKLLYLGFKGSAEFGSQLSTNDILNYAIEKLEDNCDDKLICDLAIEREDNTAGIVCILKKLADREDTDMTVELRKWRVLTVANELKTKNDNFIDGLVSLTDLWITLNYPEDTPHIFQGRNNSITPEEYYTEENYCMLYEKHIKWLNAEIKFIKSKQI
jgi:hypothetical protein